jgi:hypothetical protein
VNPEDRRREAKAPAEDDVPREPPPPDVRD